MATKKYSKKPKKAAAGKLSLGPPNKPLAVNFKTLKVDTVRISAQPGPGNTRPYCTRLLQVAGTLLIEEGQVSAELLIIDAE